MKHVALITGLLWAGATLAFAEIEGEVNPMQLTFVRQAPSEYTPGEPVEITVSISAAQLGEITAMGLYETIPPGWTFAGMRGVTAAPPAVGPEEGFGEMLEFAWITPPELPYTFAYMLNTPPDGGGSQILSGQTEYRTNAGRHVSPPVFTETTGLDLVAPVIALQGENPMVIELGTLYVEPGFSATDNVDGDLTDEVILGGFVNETIPGQYVLSYQVFDEVNNGSRATRTVLVVPVNMNSLFCGIHSPVDGASGWGDVAVLLGAALVLALGRRKRILSTRQPFKRGHGIIKW